MAVAVQANLVTLKVAWSRRANMPSEEHAIHVPAPGAVQRFREALIDRHALADYRDDELLLRTRQVWGEFAMLCWAFACPDPQNPPDFSHLPHALPMRCVGELLSKEAQIVRLLWRLRHEQRLRFEPDLRKQPAFQREHEVAQTIHARVYETDVRLCNNDDLLCCACEHAGMLGAVRWLIDDRRIWGGAGIMDIAGLPIDESQRRVVRASDPSE